MHHNFFVSHYWINMNIHGCQNDFLVRGCPMFQKNQWWANQYGSLKKVEGCEHIHELINMNPTIYIIDNNVGLSSQYI